jgi:hypothetical protein
MPLSFSQQFTGVYGLADSVSGQVTIPLQSVRASFSILAILVALASILVLYQFTVYVRRSFCK